MVFLLLTTIHNVYVLYYRCYQSTHFTSNRTWVLAAGVFGCHWTSIEHAGSLALLEWPFCRYFIYGQNDIEMSASTKLWRMRKIIDCCAVGAVCFVPGWWGDRDARHRPRGRPTLWQHRLTRVSWLLKASIFLLLRQQNFWLNNESWLMERFCRYILAGGDVISLN